MSSSSEQLALEQLLRSVRRRIFWTTTVATAVKILAVGLPLTALLIALDQRWNAGLAAPYLVLGLGLVAVFGAATTGFRGLGDKVDLALRLDRDGQLKDRVSSAWEFLQQPDLDEVRQVQVRDALRRVQSIELPQVLAMPRSRLTPVVGVGALMLALSFWVPPLATPVVAVTADAVKELQLERLAELKEELQQPEASPEVQELVKQLEKISEQFERGEIGEREVMLQLGRLDEALRAQAAALGVENLEQEMSTMVPHLMANSATAALAQALQKKQLEQASQELKALEDKVTGEKLSKEDAKKLAAQLGATAAKLGKKKSNDSFSGDLASASESLEKSDSEGFKSACRSLGQKLQTLKKCQGMKSACNSLGMCKSSLGQCSSESRNIALGKTPGKGKGGKGAGTGASGDPLGDPSRLADGMRKMVQISGQAGAGPVETETETTEGQASASELKAREVHANFAALAEEVIEKEDVPLSYRYHVKRYFQAIRPAE
ncbi:MAG: hypothetical protein J0M24_22705 [Verrucomicrobia bacterium]|nr:hypothetical protein [Verrucomicrobiota bacterium]